MSKVIFAFMLYTVFLATAAGLAWGQAGEAQDGSIQSHTGGTYGLHGSVPPLIKFTGMLRDLREPSGSKTINVSFAFYAEETGGIPLWSERQNVVLDSQGRFTTVLGSMSPGGVPSNLFASGEALWVGITPEDGIERARTMLTSVPYALEAESAQTLGGRTPDQFVTTEQLGALVTNRVSPPVGPTPRLCWIFQTSVPCPIQPSGSTYPSFEATSPVGPSFISDATTGSPFKINSSSMVANLNADLLHGLDDSAFAKLSVSNKFALNQQFSGGSTYPPVQSSGNAARPSAPQDFEAMGDVNGALVNQLFRWQVNGSGQNASQAQFTMLFGANGQTPTPTGLSINADGSINFASLQAFPGEAIVTAIASQSPPPGWGPSGTSGSGGSSVSNTPPGNQTVTQPPGTSLNVNTLNNTRTVQTSDNWLVNNIPTNLTAGVQATITLTPCPRGVDTSGSPWLGGPNGGYPIRIIDGLQPTTNSETVYVTGGTCTSSAPSGNIIFTPYFSHTGSLYGLGSASSGIQEAINDACGTDIFNPPSNGNCNIVIPPVGPQPTKARGYDIYDWYRHHSQLSRARPLSPDRRSG